MNSQVWEEIISCFEGIELKDGVSLGEAYAIDYRLGKDKREKLREKDETGNWLKVSPESISKYKGVLAFMDTKGLMFYIPAFMKYVIENFNTYEGQAVLEELTFALTKKNKKLPVFNHAQMETIIQFLNYSLSQTKDPIDAQCIKELLSGWQNS